MCCLQLAIHLPFFSCRPLAKLWLAAWYGALCAVIRRDLHGMRKVSVLVRCKHCTRHRMMGGANSFTPATS